MLIEKLQPFAIALALGLLIGIERERSHPPGIQAIGLRTLVLFSLLGTIAAWIQEPLVAWGITLFVAAIIVLSYLRSTRGRNKSSGIGITTEVSAIVTFGLGFMATRDAMITLITGVAVLVVLVAKERLHTFTRERLRTEELHATVTILVLGLGILPLLPNQAVDPWMLFNPQRFGILVLSIAIIQFGAYALARIFGPDRSLLVSGLLMGFISSAIATASFSEQTKKGILPAKAASAAILYSTVSMYIKFLVIIALISPDLMNLVSWPVICAVLVGMGFASHITRDLSISKDYLKLSNPLAVWSAIRLALVLAAMLVFVAIAQRLFGENATHAVSFLGGLFDIHSVAFALVTLHHEAELGTQPAMLGLGLTLVASFISKIVIVLTIVKEQKQFAWMTIGILLAMMLATMIVWTLVMWK